MPTNAPSNHHEVAHELLGLQSHYVYARSHGARGGAGGWARRRPCSGSAGKESTELARVGETTEPIFSYPSVGPTDVDSGREILLGEQK